MNSVHNSPFADIISAVILIAVGILMILYRDNIGAFTGYYVGRGGHVDKPTPGWMLIPFALVLIVGGVLIILRSM
jgi:uncharacterized membrane protein